MLGEGLRCWVIWINLTLWLRRAPYMVHALALKLGKFEHVALQAHTQFFSSLNPVEPYISCPESNAAGLSSYGRSNVSQVNTVAKILERLHKYITLFIGTGALCIKPWRKALVKNPKNKIALSFEPKDYETYVYVLVGILMQLELIIYKLNVLMWVGYMICLNRPFTASDSCVMFSS